MGQKVNPNIFRLGINRKWKTEFFEKKRHELPLYTFRSLEIKSYVERFLEIHGLILHDYSQQYNNSTLTLYVSYSILPKFIINKRNNTKKLVLTNRLNDSKIIKNEKSVLMSFTQGFHTSLFKTKASTDYYKVKKYLTKGSQKNIKSKMTNSVLNFSHTQKVRGVFNNFFKILSLFMDNRFNIIINFCCLNKDLIFLKKMQEKNFILLQKFKGTPFLKEGIELLFHSVYAKNSANLLAKFIAIQMKKVKRHKFFLSFINQALTVLMNSAFSKVKGIKIVIKGRLNSLPKAKHKILTIGDVPVQSIDAIIDYAQITTHNLNGSYGIKVWVVEKSNESENS